MRFSSLYLYLCLLFLSFIVLAVSSCGVRGPLYLPDEQSTKDEKEGTASPPSTPARGSLPVEPGPTIPYIPPLSPKR